MDPTLIVCTPIAAGPWPQGFRKSVCVSCLTAVWLQNLPNRGLISLCKTCYAVTIVSANPTALTFRLRHLQSQGNVLFAFAGQEA